MSRIGKQPVTIPEKVNVTINDRNLIDVKGPKGQLTLYSSTKGVTVEQEDKQLIS